MHDNNPDIFPISTEPTATTLKERSKMKVMFVKKEELLMERRIKNLEKTVQINKEIIAELLRDAQGHQYISALEKLNNENKLLQLQLRTLTKERNEYHARLLISEQIIANYKQKEQDQFVEFQEKVKDLLDQLDQKEYILQYMQHRYNRVEEVLKEHSKKQNEMGYLFRELLGSGYVEDKKGKITNVIEENKALLTDLKKMKMTQDMVENSLDNLLTICGKKRGNMKLKEVFKCIESEIIQKNSKCINLKPRHMHRKACSLPLKDHEFVFEKNLGPSFPPMKKQPSSKNKSELQHVPNFGDISSIIEDL
eukprot:TRINITY_DN88508_c0_g1_i1.p6 TRINITY_DN88508_c0_g1~~TRINITY_DN88508_c0_g1_i1.p6  ORF type:complete len:309 (+),score=48.82 TRINITY_DN88508_c0_g1_i1:4894-5820(+)